jgi:hypothetical protein
MKLNAENITKKCARTILIRVALCPVRSVFNILFLISPCSPMGVSSYLFYIHEIMVGICIQSMRATCSAHDIHLDIMPGKEWNWTVFRRSPEIDIS